MFAAKDVATEATTTNRTVRTGISRSAGLIPYPFAHATLAQVRRAVQVRGQQAQTLGVQSYNYAVAETTKDDKFQVVPLLATDQRGPIKQLSARPGTHNKPPAVLHDGQLAENYGPVFGNGVIGGAYKADLGATVELAEVNTWSYHQNSKRGTHHYSLFGGDAAADPGWNVADPTVFTPISAVDTRRVEPLEFQATSLRRSDGKALGTYRWLVWAVSPISDNRENTAFQELQVIPATGPSKP